MLNRFQRVQREAQDRGRRAIDRAKAAERRLISNTIPVYIPLFNFNR